MENIKATFLETGMFEKLKDLHESTPASWGVMNPQEMTEHLADFFDVSSGKVKTKLYTPEEHLPKYKEFLLSDKPFRENTKAPEELLGEKPRPIRYSSLQEAKDHLKKSVNEFEDHFKDDVDKKTLHPAFGMLNFEEWVLLHHKHVVHHLRQFGLM